MNRGPLGEVLALARELAIQLEADKNRNDLPGLLEVRLLTAIDALEAHVFEVMRTSDRLQGGTDASDSPCEDARFDADEKRWLVALTTLEDLLSIAHENNSYLLLAFGEPHDGDPPLIEIQDADDKERQ
jgi:hypothetical protein